jgi:hypothetical protein
MAHDFQLFPGKSNIVKKVVYRNFYRTTATVSPLPFGFPPATVSPTLTKLMKIFLCQKLHPIRLNK